MRSTTAIAATCALLACCGREVGRQEPAPAARFELRSVVAPRIAALEAEVGPDAPVPVADAETVERIRGLIDGFPEAHARMQKTFEDEIREIGDPALAILASVVADAKAPEANRLAAVQLAGAIDTPRGAGYLAAQVESAQEAWVRANAAFQLSHSTQDAIVPQLLFRLKYEIDGETVIWIANALASFRNWAGLDGLRVLSATGATEEVRANAVARLAVLAEEAGVEDGETLWRLWNDGDPGGRLARKEPSARLRLEIWRAIGRLSRQDLRAVDDARFVLARCAWWVAEPLAEALHEETVYTRLHAAQCLERMGPRAASAAPTLVEALPDARIGPAAAAALGAIAWKPGVDVLVRALDARVDPDLRNAAARALGVLGEPAAIEPLRKILSSKEPIDLRQAAARSLVALGRGDEAAPLLLDCLASERGDASAAEADLEVWLVARAGAGDQAAVDALERWKTLAPPQGVTPVPAETSARHRERTKVLQQLSIFSKP